MRNTIINNKWNTTEWGLAFLRISSFPLDPSNTFETPEEFKNYLLGLEPDKPYLGLLTTVKVDDKYLVYLINSYDGVSWLAIEVNRSDLDNLKKITEELREEVLDSLSDLEKKLKGDGLLSAFDTLAKILNIILRLKEVVDLRMSNLQREIDLTLTGVGLSGDGAFNSDNETYYLQEATSVMNALKILDGLIHSSLLTFVLNPANKDIIPLEITPTSDGYNIGASLNLSNNANNLLIKRTDGLYYSSRLSYNAGTITFRVNDNIISLFNIGISSILKQGYYDATSEEIVLEFNTQSGPSLVVRIPVGSLIREWIIDNSIGTVLLSKVEVINGPDQLSADVRISEKAHNILERDGNSLFVEGTSDAITYNGSPLTAIILDIINKAKLTSDKVDSEILDRKDETNSIKNTITEKVSELNVSIANEKSARETADSNIENLLTTNISTVSNRIDNILNALSAEILNRKDADKTLKDLLEREINSTSNTSLNTAKSYTDTAINNAKSEITTLIDDKAPINSPIFTGIPLVETSPDDNDSSLKIPTTSWVNKKVLLSFEDINSRVTNNSININNLTDLVNNLLIGTDDWYEAE